MIYDNFSPKESAKKYLANPLKYNSFKHPQTILNENIPKICIIVLQNKYVNYFYISNRITYTNKCYY